MIPILAIFGRPNVGKSTLFNRLTRSRDALVADRPGITRDRQYGFAQHGRRRFIAIDTGGMGEGGEGDARLAARISDQAMRAVQEADAVLWLVDGRVGAVAQDLELADTLRRTGRHVHLVVNKTEGLDPDVACADFYRLGIGEPSAISAEHGNGIAPLLGRVLDEFPDTGAAPEAAAPGPRVGIIGRPNVGKSTLVNRMLGEERVLIYDEPGTTRDSIAVPFERRDHRYVLVDTPGMRRRARVVDRVEKVSIARSLQAVEQADVIIAVVDARAGLTDQDIALLGLTAESGKSLIIALNKWDGLSQEQRATVRGQVRRRLGFVEYACIRYISALHGTGVGKLFDILDAIAETQARTFKSSMVTEILRQAVQAHEPPLVQGRRIKLRYAHIGGHGPVRVIVHGNQTEHVPNAYRRYLSNSLRRGLKLVGTPVIVDFKRGENPYKGRRDERKKKELAKRSRMIRRKGSRK
ncbi:MAG: ribosome biogenesis GTPase Der [Gammaproteobacteria bacterium]|nr:ribosome biogenesis GTPase Der [Gammaproteobacteria bacterium]